MLRQCVGLNRAVLVHCHNGAGVTTRTACHTPLSAGLVITNTGRVIVVKFTVIPLGVSNHGLKWAPNTTNATRT